MIYIGIDDTDIEDSRGTGHLARVIADDLSNTFKVDGVTRHQLFFDPRIPYTAKNSCAAIHLDEEQADLPGIFSRVKKIMLDNFEEGSDPGLAVAGGVTPNITAFGKRAKSEIVKQTEAFELATTCPILIAGLGGTNDGVIGALSAVGLAADGNDGRYIRVGTVRDILGLVPPQEILAGGIYSVREMGGKEVIDGLVMAEKLRPSRREGKPVLFVQKGEDGWLPLKLD